MYTDEAQGNHRRQLLPSDQPEILAKHSDVFRTIELFPITAVAADFDGPNKFFAEGAIFDGIY